MYWVLLAPLVDRRWRGGWVAYPVLGLAALEGLLDALHRRQWQSIDAVEAWSSHGKGLQQKAQWWIDESEGSPLSRTARTALKEVQIADLEGRGAGF